MLLQNYLHRIGFEGEVRPTETALTELQRHHVCKIPFENLDVQMGVPLSTAVDAAYEKLVTRGRGGWCYEQNGLFGWALSEFGFEVTRVAAAVMRQERGELADGNHLCLLVRVPDQDVQYLADVGFGGALIAPIPLIQSNHHQAPFRIGLRRVADNGWRFWEDNGSGEFSYDFIARTADETALSDKSDAQQGDPSSGFVLNLVVQRRTEEQHASLRGRVFKTLSTAGSESRLLNTADELVETLKIHFGLDVPDAVKLWPKILARHEELFPDQ